MQENKNLEEKSESGYQYVRRTCYKRIKKHGLGGERGERGMDTDTHKFFPESAL